MGPGRNLARDQLVDCLRILEQPAGWRLEVR